jgi:hypothetical protein
MDLSTLEKDLEDALAQVLSDEEQLKAAVDAVKAALPPSVPQPPVDPAWQAVQDALSANGWTAPQPAVPTSPEPPVEPAP